ncbi:MAG TPA: hypothetical protein VMH23_03815 [Bacteroidota bacterium]|nr:hypothetical protein [Bacteroidota bacterium]
MSLLQTVFLGSIITADFAFGLVAKNVLAPTQVLNIIRIDMIVPVMLMLVTRRILDRFGVLILYELVWGTFSVFAMPAAFGLPGLLKILPAVAQGIILDGLMSIFHRMERLQLYVTAGIGGILSSVVLYALKIALGTPWSAVVKLLLGIHMLSNVIIWLSAAWVAQVVWQRIQPLPIVRRLCIVSPH